MMRDEFVALSRTGDLSIAPTFRSGFMENKNTYGL